MCERLGGEHPSNIPLIILLSDIELWVGQKTHSFDEQRIC